MWNCLFQSNFTMAVLKSSCSKCVGNIFISKPCLHLTEVIDTEVNVSCRSISRDAALSEIDV